MRAKDKKAQELLRAQFWNELALIEPVADGIFIMLLQAGLTVVPLDSVTKALPKRKKSL